MAAPAFDPLTLPIESVSTDPALDAHEIDAAALRRAFVLQRPWQPDTVGIGRSGMRPGPATPAAVLIGMVQRDTGLHVLLTRRTAHLHDHAGQVSFPGGRTEPEDANAAATALRETEEEIGLSPAFIEILGVLPDLWTGTGFRIAPVVALVKSGFELTPDPFEVADIFEVPLLFLMNPAHHQTRRASLGDVVRTFYTMPYQEHFIWGATASMLRNLYCFLRAQRSAG